MFFEDHRCATTAIANHETSFCDSQIGLRGMRDSQPVTKRILFIFKVLVVFARMNCSLYPPVESSGHGSAS